MVTLSRSSRKWPNENACFSSRIHYGHALSYVFSVHLNQICKEFGLHLFQVDNHRVMTQASRSPRTSTKPISQVWLWTAPPEIQGRGGSGGGWSALKMLIPGPCLRPVRSDVVGVEARHRHSGRVACVLQCGSRAMQSFFTEFSPPHPRQRPWG